MLKTVRQVSSGLLKERGDEYHPLENIVFAVEAYSPIDEVYYVGYESSKDNPIWGQFFKFVQTPNSYSSSKTIVEVRYALHLDTYWRRFVTCKEMCHSLDADEGTHSATDRSVDYLVNSFSLLSAKKHYGDNPLKAMSAEILAEVGALELLCPLEIREDIVRTANGNVESACTKYGIPLHYGDIAFNEAIISAVREMTS